MENKMINLIGISGRISSGKDTIGKIIQVLTCKDWKLGFLSHRDLIEIVSVSTSKVNPIWGVEFENKKFAFKLKQIVSIITGIPVERLEEEETKQSRLLDCWEREQEIYESETGRKVDSSTYPKVTYTVREALQRIGTELFRDNFHVNTWVNALFADYKTTKLNFGIGNLAFSLGIRSPFIVEEVEKLGAKFGFIKGNDDNYIKIEYPNWVITDLRFKNEYKTIKDKGGITIRVDREDNSNKKGFVLKTRNSGNKLMVHQDNHPSETELDNVTDWDYRINNSGTIEDLIEQVKQILIKEQII